MRSHVHRFNTRSKALFAVCSLILASSWLVRPAVAEPKSKVEYAAGEVLVRYKQGATPNERALVRSKGLAKRAEKLELVQDLELLTLQEGSSVDDAVRNLKGNPKVEYAEPNYIVMGTATPNDPSFWLQWGLSNIRAEPAWDSGAQIAPAGVVAIIDSGIDTSHPDLKPNLWVNPGEIPGDKIDNDKNGYIDDVNGWDFANNDNNPMDDHSHGTHVAGIVGAAGNNGQGVTGTLWGVRLMALKFLAPAADGSSTGSTANAIKALNYAMKMGVKVSNNSWGCSSYSQAMFDAIKATRNIDHVFVAAAGNTPTKCPNANNDVYPHYPSSYALDNIIAVANITESDGLASDSHYGAKSVDLGAPGSSIYSTYPNGGYAYMSGTSMASPFVAGAVAMLYNARPWWSLHNIRWNILGTARPIPALAGKTVTGGTLDLSRAMSNAASMPSPGEKYFEVPIRTRVFEVSYGFSEDRELVDVGLIGKGMISWFTITMDGDYAPGLQLEYMCRRVIKGSVSNTAWLKAGEPCGIATNTGNVSLVGFAVRLTGPAAPGYTVQYSCPGPASAGSLLSNDGQFCAAPSGLDRMMVRVNKK